MKVVHSIMNYPIFHELCNRMRFGVNCVKSHHRITPADNIERVGDARYSHALRSHCQPHYRPHCFNVIITVPLLAVIPTLPFPLKNHSSTPVKFKSSTAPPKVTYFIVLV